MDEDEYGVLSPTPSDEEDDADGSAEDGEDPDSVVEDEGVSVADGELSIVLVGSIEEEGAADSLVSLIISDAVFLFL